VSDGVGAVAVPHSLFASAGDEPRRRRVDDAVMLAAAAVVVLVAALASRGSSGGAAEATEAFDRLLGWLEPLWSTAYGAAAVLVVVLVVGAIAARRWALTLDLVLAAALTVVVGGAITEATDGRWPSLTGILWSRAEPSYPSLRVALVTAVVVVAAPDLARPVRYAGRVVVGLCAVAAVVIGSAYPAHVIGGLAFGVTVAAGVRLALGSSVGFPSERRVTADLAQLGVTAADLRRADRQRGGVARYHGVDADGCPLAVAVYGRDARDTQVLARAWRALWYRDPGPAASLTRRGQVEHEALMLYTAAAARVPVPRVVAVGTSETSDALLVTDLPIAPALDEIDAADELIDEAWAAAAALRAARLGHGRLNVTSLVVTPEGVLVTDLAAARPHAEDAVLATDAAELLVSTSLVVGEDRALAAARTALGTTALQDAVPFLQRAALTPTLRDAARRSSLDVERLRERVVAEIGGEMPEVAEVRRVSLRDVLLMGLTVMAAYLLLSQLADVGISTIVDELANAAWAWVIVALVLAQLPLVCDAAATVAAVGMPLPRGPTTVLQSAIKFINLTVPSTAGKIALTMRFLERQGVARAVALTSGSIDGLAGFVVQALVLIVVVPLVDIDVDLEDADVGPLVWAGIAVLAVAALTAVVMVAVPSLRARVWPTVAAAVTNVRALASSPGRLVRLLAANVGSQILYALALGASVHAYGADATLAQLLLINTGVSLLGGLVPVPGGIGVTEAGLTAGLVAVGVDESAALAATLTHRMVTYYLPPVWGWFSLRWLGRHDYV
jgi:glycosyltransferase 2 family protein